MLKKRTIRKTHLLLLLTWAGFFLGPAANAEEPLFSNVNLFNNTQLTDLLDGDVQVAGNHHRGLHLSSGSQTKSARYVGQHDGGSAKDSGVHISWKMSW